MQWIRNVWWMWISIIRIWLFVWTILDPEHNVDRGQITLPWSKFKNGKQNQLDLGNVAQRVNSITPLHDFWAVNPIRVEAMVVV
jgi:hypothetical protein